VRLAAVEHEAPVRQVVERGDVAPLSVGLRIDALFVQAGVDDVGGRLAGMRQLPQREEALVVLAPAERTGTVSGCERGRLVEEEQLGEPAGLQERRAVPVLEAQAAGDPALAVVAPADPPGFVVQAAAVPVDEPARRGGDQVAERRDPILTVVRPRCRASRASRLPSPCEVRPEAVEVQAVPTGDQTDRDRQHVGQSCPEKPHFQSLPQDSVLIVADPRGRSPRPFGGWLVMIEKLEESSGRARVRRMRRLSIVLGLLVFAAAAAAAVGSAGLGSSPQRILLKTSDRFAVAGTHVTCRVSRKSARFANRLLCYRATTPLGNRSPQGSYAIELTDGGILVLRVGTSRPVFDRSEVAPPGAPAGSAGATALLGRLGHLRTRADKAFVEGTNIVCRPFGNPPKLSLLCVLVGRDGHIHDGTYLAFISDHGIVVALARNGKPVTVFQRVHGR
jgi:hypothetical protein